MLFILSLVLFSETYNTQAIPIASHPPQLSTLAFDDPPESFRSRTILDIVWSCLATTFACTWVCIHPNVPFREESSWTLVKRRLFLMLFTIFAPEFMIIWAFKQWRGARMIRDAINDALSDSQPWTTTHGHFLQMGGFRIAITLQELVEIKSIIRHLSGGEILEGVLSFDSFKELVTRGLIQIPTLDEDEINDKSKGDTLSKGFALMQLVWFVGHLIVRTVQGLTISELELTTAALAGLNSTMYFFWWNKPRDVRFPVVIRTKVVEHLLLMKKLDGAPPTFLHSKSYVQEDPCKSLVISTAKKLSTYLRNINAGLRYITKISIRSFTVFHVFASIRLVFGNKTRSNDEHEQGPGTSQSSLPVKDENVVNKSKYILNSTTIMTCAAFPFAVLIIAIDILLIIPISKIMDSRSDRAIAKVFGFDLTGIQETFTMIFYSEDMDLEHAKSLFGFSSFAGGVFGSVHLLAWNYSTPAPLEQFMWRAASLGVVGICISLFTSIIVLYIVEYAGRRVEHLRIEYGCILAGLGTLLPMFSVPIPIVYPIARIALLALAIMSQF